MSAWVGELVDAASVRLRHPILLSVDENELRRQLERRRPLATGTIQLPYDGAGTKYLRIDTAMYRRHKSHTDMLLASLQRRLEQAEDADARWQVWVEDMVNAPLSQEQWRVLLFTWAARELPADYLNGRQGLGRAFVTKGLKLEGRFVGLAEALIDGRVDPDVPHRHLIQIAFDLQRERDRDALFYEYSPRVLLAVASLIPAARGARLLGACYEAILGFLQFMAFLDDAESDGTITEQEVEEAAWNLLGILPFKHVQDLLLLRGLTVMGASLFEYLVQGVTELLESLERRVQALDAGWSTYVEFDPEKAVFIPDFVLRQLQS